MKNQLASQMGVSLFKSGVWLERAAHEKYLTPQKNPYGFVYSVLKDKLNISTVEFDFYYYSETWEKWQEMLGDVTKIVKEFKWQNDFFDCDNRAKFVSSLCSLFFGLNTCAEVYCEVNNPNTGFKDRHYCNIIVTTNGDAYLYDADNGCRTMRITNPNPTMGNWNYKFFSAACG